MKTVSTNLSLRLSSGKVKSLIRDTMIGGGTSGEFFKTGSLLVDEKSTFIASVKSFIMLETAETLEVVFNLDGVIKRQICTSLLLIYGEIGQVWVRALNPNIATRVNYYISTDDVEANSAFIHAVKNDAGSPVKSSVPLKMLPTKNSEPVMALPAHSDNLVFGIPQVIGIPARFYTGENLDVEVYPT